MQKIGFGGVLLGILFVEPNLKASLPRRFRFVCVSWVMVVWLHPCHLYVQEHPRCPSHLPPSLSCFVLNGNLLLRIIGTHGLIRERRIRATLPSDGLHRLCSRDTCALVVVQGVPHSRLLPIWCACGITRSPRVLPRISRGDFALGMK